MKVFLMLLLLLSACSHLFAEISVEDRWRDEGLYLFAGYGWTANVSRDGGFIELCRHADEKIQESIRIIPFAGDGQRADMAMEVNQADTEPGILFDVLFQYAGGQMAGRFSLNDSGLLKMTPLTGMEGFTVEGDIRYAFLPGLFNHNSGVFFPRHCIFYEPDKEGDNTTVYSPSENFFGGLLGDGTGIVFLAWEDKVQQVSSFLSGKVVERIDIKAGGQDIYAGLISSAGIWRRAGFADVQEGQELAVGWQRPFDAKWMVQMLAGGPGRSRQMPFIDHPVYFMEEKEKRGFHGHDAPNQTMVHPWFDEEGRGFVEVSLRARLRDNRVFIYPFDGSEKSFMGFVKDTPLHAGVVEMMSQVLPLWPHEGTFSPARFVGFAVCGGAGLLNDCIFKAGRQNRESKVLFEHIEWKLSFVANCKYVIEQYFQLKDDLGIFIRDAKLAEKDSPEVLDFLEKMEELVLNLDVEGNLLRKWGDFKTTEDLWDRALQVKERMEYLILNAHGDEFSAELNTLRWTLTGLSSGPWDYIWRFSWDVREIIQAAGYLCKNNPGALQYAEGIREMSRNFYKFPGISE